MGFDADFYLLVYRNLVLSIAFRTSKLLHSRKTSAIIAIFSIDILLHRLQNQLIL